MSRRVAVCAIVPLFLSATFGSGQEVRSVPGWQIAVPTIGTHRVCLDISQAGSGKGSGKIVCLKTVNEGRAAFIQDFFGKTAIEPGKLYRYSVRYRTTAPFAGHGQILIDCYTADGEKSHATIVSQKLGAAEEWKCISGDVVVPHGAVRVRMLLYLHGAGTIWYDDAQLASAVPDSQNLLKNGGFEPPGSIAFDLAIEKRSGPVKFFADFENSTLGEVKQIGPDEFYVHAFPLGKPHSPFVWFHFRMEGCSDREITLHVNPSPFTKAKTDTDGNGTRLPVMSYDGDHWLGIEDKRWNADGTVLTFKQRIERSPVWIASFYPFTPEHLQRFISSCRADSACSSYVSVTSLGKTKQGRDISLLAITDPTVPDATKRIVMFTALQHDLETTGAMVIEGMCRLLLSNEPLAVALRRRFIFYAIPIMDPDGISQGNMYCPVGNLNRQWGLNTTAETGCVEKFARDLKSRGRTIDLFIDFHGWCTPIRTTVFLGFGKEITDADTEAALVQFIDSAKPQLIGKVTQRVFRKRVETVTGITGDLNRLSAGWIQFEAGARLAFCVEIFGDGDCTQQQYIEWGQAFLRGIADYYQVR